MPSSLRRAANHRRTRREWPSDVRSSGWPRRWVARVELTDVGTRIADGEEIDWSSRDLTPTNAGTAAILQQLQVLERIAAHHAASLPSATIGRFPSLDLNPPPDADDAAPVRWGRLDV